MTTTDAAQIRLLLQQWATATRKGHRDDVLANHLPDVLIYDVLAPMKYEGAAAYRRSWDDWQPDTQGEGQFELQDLAVTVGGDVAFAHCFIKCGGVLQRQDFRRPGSRDLLPAQAIRVMEGGAPAQFKADPARTRVNNE
jgi:ketosteroid isomerase-like protein